MLNAAYLDTKFHNHRFREFRIARSRLFRFAGVNVLAGQFGHHRLPLTRKAWPVSPAHRP
jgi:hypothetical protein